MAWPGSSSRCFGSSPGPCSANELALPGHPAPCQRWGLAFLPLPALQHQGHLSSLLPPEASPGPSKPPGSSQVIPGSHLSANPQVRPLQAAVK